MSRPLRVEFEGAAYHVTARGNDRREVFRDDDDRLRFLATLGEACDQFALVVHGYCLTPTRYDLLTETPRGNLSQAMGWVQATWAARFNRRHRRGGHLFHGRFKALLIDADAYAKPLLRYVHLEAVRPRDQKKPVPPERRGEFAGYRWSSHRAYAGTALKDEAPEWLSLDWLAHWSDAAGLPGPRARGATGPAALARLRRAYRADLAGCFGQPPPEPLAGTRGGLVLGGEGLWEKAKALLGRSPGRQAQEWARRDTLEEARRRVAALAEREGDERLRLWLRTRLGGERMTELAREFGYADGSGVLQVVKRLEGRAEKDQALARRLRALRRSFEATTPDKRR